MAISEGLRTALNSFRLEFERNKQRINALKQEIETLEISNECMDSFIKGMLVADNPSTIKSIKAIPK